MKKPQLILVAEDDLDQSESLCSSLSDAGYHVASIHRGTDVLPRIEQLKPSLAILDIRLPGLNGMDVLKHIKLHPVYFNLPVIIVSAYASATELDRQRTRGASMCFSKPFEFKEVLLEIQKLIGEPEVDAGVKQHC